MMRWPFAILLSSLATFGVAATTTGQMVQLLVGAGCKFSSYSTLPNATATKPSYRLQLDPGLGKGIYVLQFTDFNLPEADVLIVRASGTGKSVPPAATLSGKNATGSFYSTGISGSGVTLELYKAAAPDSSKSCRGFTVVGLLFSPKELVVEAQQQQVALKVPLINTVNATTSDNNNNDESLCGTDESIEAACASNSTLSEKGAIMFAKSQPVARLSIIKENGMQVAYCTGWLIGCEGHLITNEHCISNSQDALNTKVEFLAQSRNCNDSETCATRDGCPGSVGVAGTTLIAVSSELDYALVRLGVNKTITDYSKLYAKTGYLQFRGSGPVLNESIYIPQHPMGYGKRIAWLSNGQPGRVESREVTECRKDDIGYYVDTQEGSSGSPVIATIDNHVVALHHCGGCLNGGVPAQVIIEDLIKKSLLPNCTVAGGGNATSTL